jgi:hypothetical protein
MAIASALNSQCPTRVHRTHCRTKPPQLSLPRALSFHARHPSSRVTQRWSGPWEQSCQHRYVPLRTISRLDCIGCATWGVLYPEVRSITVLQWSRVLPLSMCTTAYAPCLDQSHGGMSYPTRIRQYPMGSGQNVPVYPRERLAATRSGAR